MKRLYTAAVTLLLLFCAGNVSAQTTGDEEAAQKIYVCEGFDDEDYNLQKYSDLEFSADGKQLTIGSDVYDIEDIDSITFTKPNFPCVNIVWNGTSATVTVDPSITGVTYTVNGGHVSIKSTNITNEILYVLSGSSSDGSFRLEGSYKLRLNLNGVSLHCKKGSALYVDCSKRVEIRLKKETTNTFEDEAADVLLDEYKGAFYVKGHLELKGRGTLNVKGNVKHAMKIGEYLQFKSSTGTVNILGAVNDGIHCGEGDKDDPENSRLIMNGGEITVSNCGADCVDADDFGSMFIKAGTLTMNISSTDCNGLACDSVLYMSGGKIVANITGPASNGVRFNYDAYLTGGTIECNVQSNGGVGIKAKRTTSTTATVTKGGYVHFQGTEVKMTVSGGVYTADNTPCAGIWVDRELYQTAGDIDISVTNSAAQAIYARRDNWDGASGTRTIH